MTYNQRSSWNMNAHMHRDNKLPLLDGREDVWVTTLKAMVMVQWFFQKAHLGNVIMVSADNLGI